MSRRASLCQRAEKGVEICPGQKRTSRVRFPDELVFLDDIKENDLSAAKAMLRRASIKIDINAIGDSGTTLRRLLYSNTVQTYISEEVWQSRARVQQVDTILATEKETFLGALREVFGPADQEEGGRGVQQTLGCVSQVFPERMVKVLSMTPLHQAVVDGNEDAVRLLVSNGCDVNKQDADTWTPLHTACACGHTEIARYLLENGADGSILTEEGERPIDLIEPDDMTTVSVMLQHRASRTNEHDNNEDIEDIDSSARPVRR